MWAIHTSAWLKKNQLSLIYFSFVCIGKQLKYKKYKYMYISSTLLSDPKMRGNDLFLYPLLWLQKTLKI